MSLILSGDNGVTFPNSTTQASAGKVLQVVSGTTTTFVSSTSSTPSDTTLTATITPKFATSKIAIFVSQNGIERSASSTTNGTNLYLVRDSTTIFQFALAVGYSGSALTLISNSNVNYLDSPATTSATTYKTQYASYNNSGTSRIQSNTGDTSTIILMEIAG